MKRLYTFIYLISMLTCLPYSLRAQLWSMTDKLGSSDAQNTDQLGFSIAISDSFMIAGASWEDHDEDGNGRLNASGSAYIYKIQPDGSWAEIQKLVSPFRRSLAYYGSAVAIEGDIAMVGAIGESGGTNTSSGIVYVYRRESGDTWVLEDQLQAADPRSGDKFGESISIHQNYVMVGATGHDIGANGMDSVKDAGAAYLFKRQANQEWTEITKFIGTQRANGDIFGVSVDINASGLAIGAGAKDLGPFDLDIGAAYAAVVGNEAEFDQLTSADLALITASDPGSYSSFGIAVAMEGPWLVIGSSVEVDPPAGSTERASGAAYFFYRENNTWVEKQKVYPYNYEKSGNFGNNIDIDGTATIINSAFGFTDENNENELYAAGAAHIFELQPDGLWVEMAKIVGTQRKVEDFFGASVAIDGDRVAVGAHMADSVGTAAVSMAGAVYVFERTWALSIDDLPELENINLIQERGKHGQLRILNGGDHGDVFALKIFTPTGQLIHQENIRLYADWEKQFPKLAEGLYLVQLNKQGSLAKSWKWVKR